MSQKSLATYSISPHTQMALEESLELNDSATLYIEHSKVTRENPDND